jgi:hypothetical protein
MTTINYSHPLGKSFMILFVERSILVARVQVACATLARTTYDL